MNKINYEVVFDKVHATCNIVIKTLNRINIFAISYELYELMSIEDRKEFIRNEISNFYDEDFELVYTEGLYKEYFITFFDKKGIREAFLKSYEKQDKTLQSISFKDGE